MIVQKHQGFTLIELMIVVAIVAILASIAIPSYQSSVDRSRRAQGQSYALDLAARQERFYAAYGRYTSVVKPTGTCAGAVCGLNLPENTSDPDFNVANGWYTANIDINTAATTFEITLSPGWVDDLCGDLIYNNQQQKDMDVTPKPDISVCWR